MGIGRRIGHSRILPVAAGLLLAAAGARAQSGGADARILVQFPAVTEAAVRAEMVDNLGAINELVGLLAQGQLAQAADVAESRLGLSVRGRHAALGVNAPGRLMPRPMREMGWNLHDAASRLASVARQGDLAASRAALVEVTSACVACHATYRIR